MAFIEERVENLEEILAQTLHTVEQTSREMQAFRAEMQAYRETVHQEIQTVHQEIQAYQERSQREIESFRETVHQEIQEYKEISHQEMQAFQAEMRQFEARAETERREMKRELNRKWGELSRTLGRMAEDLIAPSIPRLLRTFIPCSKEQVVFSAVRFKKQLDGRQAEFDVIAVCGDYVLINETKNKLRPEDIKTFAEEVLPTARNFFPEYASKKFIGAIASLYVDAGQVQDGENRGLIVLGFGEDVMDVLNSAGFVPKTF